MPQISCLAWQVDTKRHKISKNLKSRFFTVSVQLYDKFVAINACNNHVGRILKKKKKKKKNMAREGKLKEKNKKKISEMLNLKYFT